MKKQLLIVALFCSLLKPAMAEEKVYSVRMKDVFIGKLTFEHELKEGRYHATVTAETAGFAKALRLASVEGEAQGKGEEYRQYFPTSSVIDIRTPEYQNEIKLFFGSNNRVTYQSADPNHKPLDFSQYEDVIDPVTAFTYIARESTQDKLCDKRVIVTDGEHLYRLLMRETSLRQDGRIECSGAIERIEGFTKEELEEHPNYEFTAIYRQDQETEYRLDWLVAETNYGTIDVAFHY